MSNQLYLVMEDDNIPYEGSVWPIAGFTDKEAAETWCLLHTAQYLQDAEWSAEQMKLAEAEIEALPDDPAGGYSYEAEAAVWAKYPNARDEWETRHRFYVHYNAIPLNPML